MVHWQCHQCQWGHGSLLMVTAELSRAFDAKLDLDNYEISYTSNYVR